MGLDLYIDVKITEKSTGICITTREDVTYEGYFSLLWWDGYNFSSLRNSLIEIVNRYSKTHYTSEDFVIPFPQSALREICSCILSFSCTPEEYRFEWETDSGYWDSEQRAKDNNIPYTTEKHWSWICWDDKQSTENLNFEYGDKLRQFIYELERINYENKFYSDIVDEYICNNDYRTKFRENPQEYEFEFRIFNSY